MERTIQNDRYSQKLPDGRITSKFEYPIRIFTPVSQNIIDMAPRTSWNIRQSTLTGVSSEFDVEVNGSIL